MNWTTPATTESQPDATGRTEGHAPSLDTKLLHITRTSYSVDGSGHETEIFKLRLGDESITLLPLRTWGQLDVHKWVVRGKLPASPAGLEITPEHVKIAGETVSIKDPDGCAKLERILAEWLAMEKQTLELARKKAAAKPAATVSAEAGSAEPQALRYHVDVDKGGQVHIRCTQGKETLVAIGLNISGFKSLASQGLMRKPRSLQIGALHDWIELDGTFFSFEKGNNDSARLEQALNEHYVPPISVGQGKDVVIYSNAASSTGFDIQFPVSVGGVTESRKRPLNEETLELLQDPVKCGLLHKGLVIKIARPTLIFKQKTPDGGEKYLDGCPENLVTVTDDDGKESIIDLSHPVNFLHLSTAELTAVFNHPSIHKHSRAATRPAPQPTAPTSTTSPPSGPPVSAPPPVAAPPEQPAAHRLPAAAALPPQVGAPPRVHEPPLSTAPAAPPVADRTPPRPGSAVAAPSPAPVRVEAPAPVTPVPLPEPPKPTPNAWLADKLSVPMTRHDWFACLVYSKVAEYFGNSSEGTLGLSHCWDVALDEVDEVADPHFKGFFLTDKGGFGFLNQGHIVRFNKEVVFIGTQEEAIEGIGVSLLGLGLDAEHRVYFIVTDGYRPKFGLPEPAVLQEVNRLKGFGAEVLSLSEVIKFPVPLELVWTAPAEPGPSGEPEAVELTKPEPPAETS